MDGNKSSTSWRETVASEWNIRQNASRQRQTALFPLAMNPFGEEEILAMTEVLLSGRLTLDQEVDQAEKKFARTVGVPYSVMVNSGSSANLLAVSAMANKLRVHHCNPGDHVLVPAVCWSTSVFPLLQNGLIPVFVDVSPRTLNTTVAELEDKLTPSVKAVMAVHVLGNAIDMRRLMNFVKKHNLILVEDTCESLGSFCLNTDDCNKNETQSKQMLGTFGDFGTFSFYFSHHITSGEGGMIACKTEEDYNLLRCLRAHGWTRHLTNRQEIEKSYPQFDSRFLFVNIGYNLRPLEVQGAMINIQLDKLAQFNQCRRDNLDRIRHALLQNKRISSIMSLMEPSTGVDPAWFGVAALLHRPYAHQRLDFLEYLEKNGIENRPIISGNFIRQPCIAAFCENERPEDYPGAEAIHTRGFFIGVHQILISQEVIQQLVDIILEFSFQPKHVILVTGCHHILKRYLHDHLQQCSESSHSSSTNINTADAEWVFCDPEHEDLCHTDNVKNIFKRHQPTRVLHFASYESSLKRISDKPVDFWLHHVTINNNILHTAFQFQEWVGPIKVVCLLSANFSSLVTSELLTPSMNPYVYAHEALLQLIKWYRQQYACNFIAILADNTYGPYHDFTSNFVDASDMSLQSLITTIWRQIEKDPSTPVTLPGTDDQVSRLLFARDLAHILIWVMSNYDDDDQLLVNGTPILVSEVIRCICDEVRFDQSFVFAGNLPKHTQAETERHRSGFKCADVLPITMTSPISGIRETVQMIWRRLNSN